MNNLVSAPQICFTVRVDISTNPAEFTIYDANGRPTTDPVDVNVNNTQLVYRLVDNNQNLVFVDPDISHDEDHDLTHHLSEDGQTLTITDSDADDESICLKLVVATSTDPDVTYTSPDPLIKNRPPE